jgi:hypothetical protein
MRNVKQSRCSKNVKADEHESCANLSGQRVEMLQKAKLTPVIDIQTTAEEGV